MILVKPTSCDVGDELMFRSNGTALLDMSRDDLMTSGYSVLLWNDLSSGAVAQSALPEGQSVIVGSNVGVGQFRIESIDTYLDGNISVDFSITSLVSKDTTVTKIEYAKLLLNCSLGQISVTRGLVTGLGHYVWAEMSVGSAVVAYGALKTSENSGRLRIVKCGKSYKCLFNDQVVLEASYNDLGGGFANLITRTYNAGEQVEVLYSNFVSSFGLRIGDKLVHPNSQTQGAIFATAPNVLVTTQTVAYPFNHDGELSATEAFTINKPSGTSLNSPGTITVISDDTLR